VQSYYYLIMIKYKPKTFLLIALALIVSACSTNIDINAPWRPITVVYGLLDQKDTIHYIRVNKAFLGDTSAYVMAQQADSLIYNNVEVRLKKVNISTGNVVRTFVFTDTIINKDPGIFATDKNKVYYYKGKILDDNESAKDFRYDLYVYVADRNKQITASTYLLDDVNIKNPPYTDYASVNLTSQTPYKVIWETVARGRLYQLKMRFHYYEVTNTDTVEKYLDMTFPRLTSINDLGGQDLSSVISKETFLNFLANHIEENPNIKRYVKKETLDFYVYIGSNDTYKYMQITNPSNSIVQDRPFFTNINGGVGLFSARTYTLRAGKKLERRSIDEIANNNITRKLNFQDYETSTYFWSNLK